MRLLSARLIVSLILGVTLVSLLSSYIEVRGEQRRLRRDLGRRAEVLGESLAGNVEPAASWIGTSFRTRLPAKLLLTAGRSSALVPDGTTC